MLADNNLVFLILSFLSVLFYVAVIYNVVPRRTLRVRPILSYMMAGSLSYFFLSLFTYLLFPNWGVTMEPLINGSQTLFSSFFQMFVQVGFGEEWIKFTLFFFICFVRNGKVRYDSPLATMVYCGMVGAGFGLMENISYAVKSAYEHTTIIGPLVVGKSILDGFWTILMRHTSATLLHTMLGMSVGYFVALARKTVDKNSWFEGPYWLRYILYSMVGVLLASCVHGLYNFVLQSSPYWIIIKPLIMLNGVILIIFAGRHLWKLQTNFKIRVGVKHNPSDE